MTDPAAAGAAIAVATSAFGRLDVVVNNAGYANINSIEDVADDDFHAQVDTNFFGVVTRRRTARFWRAAGRPNRYGMSDPVVLLPVAALDPAVALRYEWPRFAHWCGCHSNVNGFASSR